MPDSDQDRPELEREKWRDELRLREREIAIKEREQRSHEEELRFKLEEQKRSRWASPLVLAVLAAAVAASGNAIVAWLTANAQHRADLTQAERARSLDESKSEADRILEVIKTNNDPDKAAINLKFLVDAGLIQNPKTRGPLETYLKTRKPGEGVTLPAAVSTTTPSARDKVRLYKETTDLVQRLAVGPLLRGDVDRFWVLYWKDLIGIESNKFAQTMIAIGRIIKPQDGTNAQPELKQLADELLSISQQELGIYQ